MLIAHVLACLFNDSATYRLLYDEEAVSLLLRPWGVQVRPPTPTAEARRKTEQICHLSTRQGLCRLSEGGAASLNELLETTWGWIPNGMHIRRSISPVPLSTAKSILILCQSENHATCFVLVILARKVTGRRSDAVRPNTLVARGELAGFAWGAVSPRATYQGS